MPKCKHCGAKISKKYKSCMLCRSIQQMICQVIVAIRSFIPFMDTRKTTLETWAKKLGALLDDNYIV